MIRPSYRSLELHVPSSQSWYDAHGTDRDDRLSTNDVPVTPGTMALSAGWPDDTAAHCVNPK